jgi:uncharacterized protein (DUF1697 family)
MSIVIKKKMNTYICILRGINVSGQKIVKMDELKNLFQKLGFNAVQTYIQSGNVVFQSEQSNQKELEVLIANRVMEVFGFDVPVLVKSNKELQSIFEHNPFLKNGVTDITKLHVTFLSAIPDAALVKQLAEFDFGTDDYVIDNSAIYIHCPENGYGKTKLSNQFLESKLKLSATTRNWKTITQLIAMV